MEDKAVLSTDLLQGGSDDLMMVVVKVVKVEKVEKVESELVMRLEKELDWWWIVGRDLE